MVLEKITGEVVELAREVGIYVKKAGGELKNSSIHSKGLNNFVTDIDRESERKLVKGLSNIVSKSGFITEEETTEQSKKDLYWIVDPIDGTTNFIHGLPCYAISIALRNQEETLLGVVHEISGAESFYAWKGSSVFLNGEEVSCNDCPDLSHALLSTGFPYEHFDRLKDYVNLLTNVITKTRGVRRWGSAAVDLAFVAAGRYDGFFEYGLNSWDVAAGAFLVERAGGQVTDFKGGDNYLFGKEIIATAPKIFDELAQIIDQRF